MTSPSTCSVGL